MANGSCTIHIIHIQAKNCCRSSRKRKKEKLEESRGQLTFEEVTTKFLKKQINEEKIQDQVLLRDDGVLPNF